MSRPRLHDAALRSRLLETASETISTGGTAALTVRGVATAAGTSASAVYALFGSREHLLAEVGAEGFRRFAAHLARAPRTADPRADLAALGLAYRASALADPHFYRVMFERSSPADEDVPPLERPTFVVLRDAVARVRPETSPAEVESVAVGLWGLVHGLVTLELAGHLPGDDDARAARYAATAARFGSAVLDRTR